MSCNDGQGANSVANNRLKINNLNKLHDVIHF